MLLFIPCRFKALYPTLLRRLSPICKRRNPHEQPLQIHNEELHRDTTHPSAIWQGHHISLEPIRNTPEGSRK